MRTKPSDRIAAAVARLRRQKLAKSGAERKAAFVSRHASIEAWCGNRFGKEELPSVADPTRREACRLDLALFLRTYLPAIFTRPFSAAGLRFIGDLQTLILGGGLKAIAEPRGTGKTATVSGAMLWAALYGHRRYLAAIAATDSAATQLIKDILANIQGEEFVADFPEYSIPFLALEGRAQRCASQTYRGKQTRIQQKIDCLVLPSLRGGPGDGAVIQAAGLTGAIRGMHQVTADHVWIRPDFALLDDPQTRESAKSGSQTSERERIILGDVMGLAGHEREISAVMACTVISKGDLADRFLDTKERPEWRGQRERLVTAWGGTDELWAEYDALWRDEESGRAAKGAALEWWKSHRDEIEAGAQVLDPNLYGVGEASALHHARNLYLKHGEFAFQAEYQNDPPSLQPEADYTITPPQVAAHLSHRPRGETDEDAVKVVAAVDVNRYAAAWCVVAATSAPVYEVIDYGFWVPAGRRELWGEGEKEAPQVAVSNAVFGVVRDILKTKPYSPLVSVVAVDAGFQAPTVYSACAALAREFRGKRIIPSRGLPGDKYFEQGKARTIRRGELADYRKTATAAALMYWDSHAWHMTMQRGFLLPVSADGAVSVFGDNPREHSIFADQICADKLERTFVNAYGKTVAVWTTNGRNEQGDVTAMALAAISCEGVTPAGVVAAADASKEAAEIVRRQLNADPGAKAAKIAETRNMAARPFPFRRAGWARRW